MDENRIKRELALFKHWFRQTKNHPRALRNVVMDTQWYVFFTLFIFLALFAATSIMIKPLFGLWLICLSAIHLLFKTAMNYAEID